MALDTITHAEFDQRLEAANGRLRQELAEAQERVRQLEALIQRKEAFAQKLDRVLTDIERDEAEIAAAEKELRPRRSITRRRSGVPTVPVGSPLNRAVPSVPCTPSPAATSTPGLRPRDSRRSRILIQ